jgi:hypothetical protein
MTQNGGGIMAYVKDERRKKGIVASNEQESVKTENENG